MEISHGEWWWRFKLQQELRQDDCAGLLNFLERAVGQEKKWICHAPSGLETGFKEIFIHKKWEKDSLCFRAATCFTTVRFVLGNVTQFQTPNSTGWGMDKKKGEESPSRPFWVGEGSRL